MSWSADDLDARFNFMRVAHTGLPPLTSISTFELAGALIYLEFFVILAILANILDYFSYARFKDALDDAPIIRALSRMSQLQNTAFVVDRVLDGAHPCNPTSTALTRPAEASARALFPLLAVARGAASPVEMLLESHVLPDDSRALIVAAARANGVACPDAFLRRRFGSVADRVNAAVGTDASCSVRCCALRRVIARYVLLKMYFSHTLMSPFTRFNPRVTRVSQVGMLFKHLLAVILAGVALYSFYSKGVGKVDDTSYLTVYFGAFHLLGIVFTIAICESTRLIIGSLLEAGSELTFSHRYPLVNAERIRRHAADLRAAVMTPAELAAAIATARFAQSAQRAGGGLPTLTEGGGEGEETGGGGDRPRIVVESTAPEVVSSPTGAAATTSLLLQNPTDEYLLAIAAAPFFAEVVKSGGGPLSTSVTSVDDGSGRTKITLTAAANGTGSSSKKEPPVATKGGESAGDAVIDVIAGAKSVPPVPAGARCCASRARLRAPKDEAAVLAEDDAVRKAAAREETRAQLLWETAQKSLSAARSAHAAYAALSLRDTVLAVCSDNAYLFKFATLGCFLAVAWYVLVGLARQSDAVIENYFTNFLIYQAVLFLVVEPLQITATTLGQLVVWPGLRALIFRAPFGVGRAMRRFVARANARVKDTSRNNDPAAVRAAAIAVHFPAALAVFAYGGALAFSSVTSGAVDARVAKATTNTDQQIVADAIAQRAEDTAIQEADAEADHMEAEDAARASGAAMPPPPPHFEHPLPHHVISSEERVALANFEILKTVAGLELAEAERIASHRGAADAPSSPSEHTPRTPSEGRSSFYAELRSGVASLADSLARRPSMRRIFATSNRSATVAPAPPQQDGVDEGAPSEPAAVAAAPPSDFFAPFQTIATSVSDVFSYAASASARMLASLSPTSPSQLGGNSTFVPFPTAAAAGDGPAEDALLNELTFDFGPHIEGPLAAWRGANPDAQFARLNGRRDLTDDDCAFLRGVRVLNIANCSQLTDAAFVHFSSVEVLVMNGCANITAAGFAHMPRLRKLLMKHCVAATDASFKRLVHLRQLDIDGCRKLTVAALDGLSELRIVSAHSCDPKLKARAEEIMNRQARRPVVAVVRARAAPASAAHPTTHTPRAKTGTRRH